MINAVVAEDHVLMRAGIVAALGAIDGVTVVDECGSKDALLAAVDRSAPDLVVTDIRMPPTHTSEGIDAARAIRASSPSTAVLVLSEYVETGYVVSLFEDGAASLGYLLKSNVGDLGVLRRAIATVCGGGLSIDPEVVAATLVPPTVVSAWSASAGVARWRSASRAPRRRRPARCRTTAAASPP